MIVRAFILFFVACTAIVVGGTCTAEGDTAHRHALLVGISNYHAYNHTGLFPDIHCDRDVEAIEQALVTTFKFKATPDEIVTLTSGGTNSEPSHPEQTTRAAIIAALDMLATETAPGDIVYIHFSCHGDQVLDPTEPGGLDSAIVPTDYKDSCPPEQKTASATNEISGKTILAYIRRIQDAMRVNGKIDGQLIISFDSCHSASAARGLPALKRGSSFDEYVTWYRDNHPAYTGHPTPHTSYAQPEPNAAPVEAAGSIPQRTIDGGSAWQDLSGSGYVVISACQNNACAYETTDAPSMGRLSCCLANVIAQAQADTTYQQVFDRVNALFHASYDDQFPQIDGDPNTMLFGGTATPPPASITAFYKAPGAIDIEAGSLQNMTDGSLFALYPKDAPQTPDREVAEAKIVGPIGLTSATMTVTKALNPITAPLECGAVEIEHVYPVPPLSIDPQSIRRSDPSDASAILTRINAIVSTTATHPDLQLARVPHVGGARGATDLALLQCVSNRALVLLNTAQGDVPGQVFDALSKEAKYRYACQLGDALQQTRGGRGIALRIVPITAGRDADGVEVIATESDALTSTQNLTVGDKFVIEVQNTSGIPLHLALLDITGAHKVGVVWTASMEHTDDNLLPPTSDGKWTPLWKPGRDISVPAIFTAIDPDSDEIVKAVATPDFTDLSTLSTRGPTTPTEQLIRPAIAARDFVGDDQEDNIALPPHSFFVCSTGIRIADKVK